jgi:hypothetical protein
MNTKVHILLASAMLLAAAKTHAQPTITSQPTNQSVSLGASASFQVSTTITNPPILYQWRFINTNLPLATNFSLALTNIQMSNAGAYDVMLTDASGSTTSQVARLEVDPAFTKITSGGIVNDVGNWIACAWGDYDNDGFIDLFITCLANANGSNQRNALYHNNGDGTFTRFAGNAPVNEYADWRFCAWADYDNDGRLDLFVTHVDGNGFPDQASLYRNSGNNTFTKMTANFLGTKVSGGYSEGCAWADYDNDGFLDIFVARYGWDWLLHNNGDGSFTRLTDNTGIPPDNQDSYGLMWGDYDGDGWPDLFVTVKNDYQTNQSNFLYRNNRNGTFTKIVSGSIVTDNEYSISCAWVDYANDGSLDLFVVNGLGVSATNSLYHNNGDGTFTKKTSLEVGSIASDAAVFVSSSWGDYDNDGFIDCFVTALNGEVNFLYHNNGDGTFTRVLSGSLANDIGKGSICAWGDYDNDGFLDLFVARGGHDVSNNLLYRNNGNSNGWVKIKLVGALSNRSAIGAKVHVKATIGGKTFWQLREIRNSSSPLEAHFGLGDATNIDQVRIEWPSGVVQTRANVPPRQFLTVVEHQAIGTIIKPSFTGASRATNGVVNLSAAGDAGLLYLLEASTNLVNWTKVGVRSNATGIVQFTDPKAPNYSRRFYRVSAP